MGIGQHQQQQPHQTGFDPAFVITHSGRVGSSVQHSAAQAFFAKKNQKFGIVAGGPANGQVIVGRQRHNPDSEDEKQGGRQERKEGGKGENPRKRKAKGNVNNSSRHVNNVDDKLHETSEKTQAPAVSISIPTKTTDILLEFLHHC